MARNKKNVLNQSVKESVIKEEPKKVTTEGLVYGEDYVEDPNIERKLVEKSPSTAIFEMSLKDSGEKLVEEISLKVSGEKLAEVIKEKEQKTIMAQEEGEDLEVEGSVVPRGIRDISKDDAKKLKHKDLRMFRRTGRLPQ